MTEQILTAKRVNEIFVDCLFRDGEFTNPHVTGEGVMIKAGFHPERLASHKAEIRAMLFELPEKFRASIGGGLSFLAGCETEDGTQWGEQRDLDQLLTLGVATEQAMIPSPRDMWPIFPGGMPFFAVLDNTAPKP